MPLCASWPTLGRGGGRPSDPATSAYTTATSAASVTVITPEKIPPKTSTGIPSGTVARRTRGPERARRRRRDRPVLRRARTAIRHEDPARTNAGTNPARNSVTIERFASDPSTTIVRQGGTRMPMAEAAATMLTDSGPVAGLLHRGDEERADRGDVRRRRAGDAREEDLRHHDDHRQAAAHVPDDGHRRGRRCAPRSRRSPSARRPG